MKKFVKLYEEFNPDEFLEGFDIAQFIPKSFIQAVNDHNWKIPIIKIMLLDGKLEFLSHREAKKTIIKITAKSNYVIYGAPTQRKIMAPLLRKDPKDSIKNKSIDVYWKFLFIKPEPEDPDTIKLGVRIKYEAKHQKFPDFSATGMLTEKIIKSNVDMGKALRAVIDLLDHMDAYSVSEGLPNYFYRNTDQIHLGTPDNPDLNSAFDSYLQNIED